MDTPKTMRERAEQLRQLAAHHPAGTADALLEAACDLERTAYRLEHTPPPPVEPAPPMRDSAGADRG
jgi:hypothetical protein